MTDANGEAAVEGATDAPKQSLTLGIVLGWLFGTSSVDQLSANMRRTWNRRVGGILLAAMYALVFYTVVLSLTALQVQTRIQANSNNGGAQSLWTVIRYANQARKTDLKVAEKSRERDGIEADNDKLNKQRSLVDAEYNTTYSAAVSLMNRYQVRPPEYGEMEKVLTQLKEMNFEKPTDNDERNQLSKKIERHISDYGIIDAELQSNDSKIKRITSEINSDSKGPSANSFPAGMQDVVDELRFFGRGSQDHSGIFSRLWRWVYGAPLVDGSDISYVFVTLPNEVLILNVVIAMGIMGSMISITQLFFAGEDRPVTFYLFRPLLGAVVAIGIYVITKAGVVVASNTPIQGQEAGKLSPFFVAFVSLIAGLMSESAINSIRSAGTAFLRGDPVTETARYAKGVAEAMKADNKKNEDLYSFFDRPPDVIDKWVAEEEPVPGDAQRIIAAWLEQPVRDLFSDLPGAK